MVRRFGISGPWSWDFRDDLRNGISTAASLPLLFLCTNFYMYVVCYKTLSSVWPVDMSGPIRFIHIYPVRLFKIRCGTSKPLPGAMVQATGRGAGKQVFKA